MLIKEVNKVLKEKCSRLLLIYISYDSCWTVANGSLNPDLFFLDNVHLVKQGNLKLAESIFSSIKNCNGVTCNNQKQLLMSYRMAVSFKLNNSDFPLYLFLLYLNLFPLFLFRYHLLLHVGLPDMLVLFPINLSLILPTSVMALFVQVSILANLFVLVNLCLSNVRPSKPTISSNFYLSKPVSPRNISFSRSIRSSDVCQS